MIEAIRDYFISYFDRLNPSSPLSVDYLKEEPVSYSIESGISDPWVERYIDGGGIKQYAFMLTSRDYYGSDEDTNIANLQFYDYIAKQIEENNDLGLYPDVPGAYAVQVLTPGYVIETGVDTARYQIQLRLLYTV